jgi:hypothetical protein
MLGLPHLEHNLEVYPYHASGHSLGTGGTTPVLSGKQFGGVPTVPAVHSAGPSPVEA